MKTMLVNFNRKKGSFIWSPRMSFCVLFCFVLWEIGTSYFSKYQFRTRQNKLKGEKRHFGEGLSETLWQELGVFSSTPIKPPACLLVPPSKIATGMKNGSTIFFSFLCHLLFSSSLSLTFQIFFLVFKCRDHPIFGQWKPCEQILWDGFTMAIQGNWTLFLKHPIRKLEACCCES